MRISGFGTTLVVLASWSTMSGATAPPAGKEVVRVSAKAPCSGVAVGKDTVLTAKHCVNGPATRAVVLAPDLSDPFVAACVLAVHGKRDIALLKTKRYPGSHASLGSAAPTTSDTVTLAGMSGGSSWQGNTKPRFVASTGQYFDVNPIGGVPCNGDSGGPAFLNGAVVGIADELSASFTCGTDPTRYTVVVSMGAWIAQHASSSSCDEELDLLEKRLQSLPKGLSIEERITRALGGGDN